MLDSTLKWTHTTLLWYAVPLIGFPILSSKGRTIPHIFLSNLLQSHTLTFMGVNFCQEFWANVIAIEKWQMDLLISHHLMIQASFHCGYDQCMNQYICKIVLITFLHMLTLYQLCGKNNQLHYTLCKHKCTCKFHHRLILNSGTFSHYIYFPPEMISTASALP